MLVCLPVLFFALGGTSPTLSKAADSKAPPAAPEKKPPAKPDLTELARALTEGDVETKRRAIKGLARLGVEAVPYLVEALRDKEKDVRNDAAYGLRIQKVDPKALVPVLRPLLKDEDPVVRQGVVGALGKCGVDAVPLLTEALQDKEPGVRRQAVQGLKAVVGKNPKEAEAVMPALAKVLNDDAALVRLDAVQTLARCGPEAMPHLLAALKDKDVKVRGTAVEALVRGKPEVKTVLPPLVALFKGEEDVVVRHSILRALAKIGPDAVPHLIEILQDKDDSVLAVALKSLGQVGLEAKEAVPAVKTVAVKASNPNIRAAAAETLGKLGPDSIPALLELLKGANTETRLAVLPGLARMEKLPNAATPLLIEALGDQEVKVRALAAHVLGQMGPQAKDAVAALTKLLDDPNPALLPYVKEALKKIEEK